MPDDALMRWEWEGGAVLFDGMPAEDAAVHAEMFDSTPRITRQLFGWDDDAAAASERKNEGRIVVGTACTHEEAV